MRRKNDVLLKSAFEESFPDLLRFFFRDADATFDMERGFEFMDKELHELFPELNKKGGSRFVDMLVKTYLNNGLEEWILVHIEIQNKNGSDFPKRMHQYWYRIYDRYEVAVAALAVFTGSIRQRMPNRFHKEFLGTKITYEFNTYHILDHSEDELLAMNNPFALIVLAAQKILLQGKIPEEELGRQRLAIARALIQSDKYQMEQVRRFLFFLKTFVHIDNSVINNNFDKEVASLTGNQITMGIIETIKMLTREEALEEGIEKGIERGSEKKSYEVVTKLLLSGKFSVSEVANFAGVTETFVKNVRKDIGL